jgi:hypothetical protein
MDSARRMLSERRCQRVVVMIQFAGGAIVLQLFQACNTDREEGDNNPPPQRPDGDMNSYAPVISFAGKHADLQVRSPITDYWGVCSVDASGIA